MAQAEPHPQAARRSTPLRTSRAAVGLGGLAVVMIAASCGGSAATVHTAAGAGSTPTSTSTSSSSPAGAVSAPAANALVISTARNAKFGTILVSSTALYTVKPSSAACTAACLKIWPAVLLPPGTTAATAGPGVSASKLGTVASPAGGRQVTYDGRALYWFSGDTAPGQVNGNVTDVWGTWTVAVTAGPSAAPSSHTSGGAVTSTTAGSHSNRTPTTTRAPTTTRGPGTTQAPTTTRAPGTTQGPGTTQAPPTTRPPTPTTSPPTTSPPTTTAPTTTTTAPSSGGGAF